MAPFVDDNTTPAAEDVVGQQEDIVGQQEEEQLRAGEEALPVSNPPAPPKTDRA